MRNSPPPKYEDMLPSTLTLQEHRERVSIALGSYYHVPGPFFVHFGSGRFSFRSESICHHGDSLTLFYGRT
jgi:hypothetical protein